MEGAGEAATVVGTTTEGTGERKGLVVPMEAGVVKPNKAENYMAVALDGGSGGIRFADRSNQLSYESGGIRWRYRWY